MNKILLVLALAAPLALCIPVCPRYACSSPALNQNFTTITDFVCSNETSPGSFVFDTCPQGMTCDWKNTQRCVLAYNGTGPYMPGELCYENSQCQSRVCKGGSCDGKDHGEACANDTECDMDLGCINGECSTLSAIGQKCDFVQRCQGYATCVNSYCILKGTLPNNAESSDRFACTSLFTMYNFHDVQVCHSPPLLNGYAGQPITCDLTTPCSYHFDGSTLDYKEECKCGVNNAGTSYCFPGIGNYADKISTLIDYIQQQPRCHISKPYFCNNQHRRSNYWKAFMVMKEITEYAAIQGNDKCVRQDVMYEFYNAINQSNPTTSTSSSTTTGASSLTPHIFALLLLFAILI